MKVSLEKTIDLKLSDKETRRLIVLLVKYVKLDNEPTMDKFRTDLIEALGTVID